MIFLKTVPRISRLEIWGHISSAFRSGGGWWIGRKLGWLLQIYLSIKHTHRPPVPVGSLNSEDLSHLCSFSVLLSQYCSVAEPPMQISDAWQEALEEFHGHVPILPRITQTCCVWLMLCHIVHSPTLCSVSHSHRVWIMKDNVKKNLNLLLKSEKAIINLLFLNSALWLEIMHAFCTSLGRV